MAIFSLHSDICRQTNWHHHVHLHLYIAFKGKTLCCITVYLPSTYGIPHCYYPCFWIMNTQYKGIKINTTLWRYTNEQLSGAMRTTKSMTPYGKSQQSTFEMYLLILYNNLSTHLSLLCVNMLLEPSWCYLNSP